MVSSLKFNRKLMSLFIMMSAIALKKMWRFPVDWVIFKRVLNRTTLREAVPRTRKVATFKRCLSALDIQSKIWKINSRFRTASVVMVENFSHLTLFLKRGEFFERSAIELWTAIGVNSLQRRCFYLENLRAIFFEMLYHYS